MIVSGLRKLRIAWSICGLTLFLVVAVDLALSILFDGGQNSEDLSADLRRNGFPDEPWVVGFLEETARSAGVDWKPYVYWQRKPFQGDYINVGEEGIRKTWQPDDPRAAHGREIFMFGGSTLWGSGARDGHTIPSELARLFANDGMETAITNFGETGYVTTQEVIRLTLELQKGNVPRLVIFYDGVNDVFSSLQAGRAGWPQNEAHRVAEFNILGSRRRLFREASRTGFERSGIGQFARWARRGMEAAADVAPRLASEALARETVEYYEKNVDIVEGLGRAFGFEAAFFWQPAIFTKTPLTPYEEDRERDHRYAAEMYRSATAHVRGHQGLMGRPHFFDLSGVFENDPAQRYVDFCHTNESANRKIASRIYEKVKLLLSS
jgi:lysophospholipase L1-like esterase